MDVRMNVWYEGSVCLSVCRFRLEDTETVWINSLMGIKSAVRVTVVPFGP